MKITFHGAARTVTGSRHLLETASGRVLLDCGLVQGPRKEAEARNRSLGFDPKSLDAVILSHAHIDHSGVLPVLVKEGFEGPIFCTPATRDIAGVMLMDSASIQVSDAGHLNRHRRPSDREIEPLYTPEDAREAIGRFVAVPYGRELEALPNVRFRFADAGHILGSAVTSVTERAHGTVKRVVFTGDLGRRNFPILRNPEPVPQADAFLTESTYGGRDHAGEVPEAKTQLFEVIRKTVERGGHVIVPAFALGRAQTLTYLLHELWMEGKLGRFPIFVDSPLSINVTSIYRVHPDCFDRKTAAYLDDDVPGDPFGFGELKYLRSSDESRTLNNREGAYLVIAASGMCEGGRVLHHLKHGIGDERNTVLMVGFSAQHTLGRRLVDGAKTARIFGGEYPVRAEVLRLDGLSQHAGRQELLDYAMSQKKAQIAFCVHGEEEQSEALAEGMRAGGFARVEVPSLGQTFEL
ncbi:MAG: MBL fold metallo-hydrolase [Candidatus Brocadiae bacterium]|nr:MBL fold metallo-hydrolase [Candidatus Brocadiia bacterium]